MYTCARARARVCVCEGVRKGGSASQRKREKCITGVRVRGKG